MLVTDARGERLLVAIGLIIIALPVATYFWARHDAAADLEGIRAMTESLVGMKAELAAAPTAAESARVNARIAERQMYLGRRAEHGPYRDFTSESGWALTSWRTITSVIGAAVFAMGVALIRRRRSTL